MVTSLSDGLPGCRVGGDPGSGCIPHRAAASLAEREPQRPNATPCAISRPTAYASPRLSDFCSRRRCCCAHPSSQPVCRRLELCTTGHRHNCWSANPSHRGSWWRMGLCATGQRHGHPAATCSPTGSRHSRRSRHPSGSGRSRWLELRTRGDCHNSASADSCSGGVRVRVELVAAEASTRSSRGRRHPSSSRGSCCAREHGKAGPYGGMDCLCGAGYTTARGRKTAIEHRSWAAAKEAQPSPANSCYGAGCCSRASGSPSCTRSATSSASRSSFPGDCKPAPCAGS